jgi:putative NADH-flavin reductase
MKVTVFGANGDSGKEIVKSLVENGHSVVAAVRRLDTMTSTTASESVQVVQYDFSDASSVKSAMQGADAVISAIGTGKFRAAREATTLYRDATRAIRKAMRECGIKRVIVLSSGGVDEEYHQLPWIYSNIIRRYIMNTYIDMARMETVLEESDDLDWTSVRLTYLLEGKSQPDLAVADRGFGDRKRPSGKIHFVDVGKFVAKEVEENKWVKKMPVISYP